MDVNLIGCFTSDHFNLRSSHRTIMSRCYLTNWVVYTHRRIPAVPCVCHQVFTAHKVAETLGYVL